jgi:hypothetical protein
MSTFRNPVGPQSSSVYWRRRLVVLIGLVAVVIIVALIIFRPGGTTPSASPSNSSSHSPTPSSSSSNDPVGAVKACAPSVVTVEAVTNKASYGSGEKPLLSMVVTNTGTVPCTFSAGSDVQVYLITSGSDQIWTSTDCQTDPVSQQAELAPGVPTASTPFPWDRTRSSTTTCDGKRPTVAAGGASYHLSVTVSGVSSETTKQFVLN